MQHVLSKYSILPTWEAFASLCWFVTHTGVHRVVAPPLLCTGGAVCYPNSCSQPFNWYSVAHSFGNSAVIQSLSLPNMVGRGLLSRFETTQLHSKLQISGCCYTWWFWYGSWVSGWWTLTCLPEHFVVWSQFSLGSQARCQLLPTFCWTRLWGLYLFRPACQRIWAWCMFILMDSIKMPKLDVSCDKPDAFSSSVSSGFFAWLVPFCQLQTTTCSYHQIS